MSLYSIALSVIIVIALCRNVLILIKAICMVRAIKLGQSICCPAKIVMEYGRINRNVLFSTWYAKAQYTVKNERVVGVMLAPVHKKLIEGQEIEILVNCRFPRVFAISQKHAYNTAVKYFIFCVFFGIALFAVLVSPF